MTHDALSITNILTDIQAEQYLNLIISQCTVMLPATRDMKWLIKVIIVGDIR